MGAWGMEAPERAQYPLIKVYTLNYKGLHSYYDSLLNLADFWTPPKKLNF